MKLLLCNETLRPHGVVSQPPVNDQHSPGSNVPTLIAGQMRECIVQLRGPICPLCLHPTLHRSHTDPLTVDPVAHLYLLVNSPHVFRTDLVATGPKNNYRVIISE